MPTFDSNNVDARRLAYLISIRWYLLAAGALGCLVAASTHWLGPELLFSGVFGGLAFALGMFGAAMRRNRWLFLSAVMFCVLVYFLPFLGREFRGVVIAHFFFCALTAFSMVLLVVGFFRKERAAEK